MIRHTSRLRQAAVGNADFEEEGIDTKDQTHPDGHNVSWDSWDSFARIKSCWSQPYTHQYLKINENQPSGYKV